MYPLHLTFISVLAFATPLARGAETLNDSQILNTVIAANVEEVTLGRLALKKATQPKVRTFAKTMVEDHSSSLRKAQQIAKKLRISPQTSDSSEDKNDETRKKSENLSAKPGADFDRDYVEQMEESHRKLLEKLDRDLIAQTQSADLKSFLQATRATVEAHLNHAKELRTKLQ
jgi:putative membrane protein